MKRETLFGALRRLGAEPASRLRLPMIHAGADISAILRGIPHGQTRKVVIENVTRVGRRRSSFSSIRMVSSEESIAASANVGRFVSPNDPFIVHLIDDDDDARESIAILLQAMDLLTLSYRSAEDFYARYTPGLPGCLLADFRMPDASGVEIARRLRTVDPALPVVILSGYINVHQTVEAMQLGAVTVLTKPIQEGPLRDAIATSQDESRRRLQRVRRRAEVDALLRRLSANEIQVLACLEAGLPNKASAATLSVSIRTIEDRRSRIMRKLEVDSLAELIQLLNEARGLGIDPTRAA